MSCSPSRRLCAAPCILADRTVFHQQVIVSCFTQAFSKVLFNRHPSVCAQSCIVLELRQLRTRPVRHRIALILSTGEARSVQGLLGSCVSASSGSGPRSSAHALFRARAPSLARQQPALSWFRPDAEKKDGYAAAWAARRGRACRRGDNAAHGLRARLLARTRVARAIERGAHTMARHPWMVNFFRWQVCGMCVGRQGAVRTQ